MALCLHSGAAPVDFVGLQRTNTPPATRTHKPIAHAFLVELIRHHLSRNGWQIAEEKYGLWGEENERMFGFMDIFPSGVNPDSGDFNLSLGIRNSHDKRFPAGFCLGTHVFVCDNLAFASEIVVMRRHTRNVLVDLDEMISVAVDEKLMPASLEMGEAISAFHSAALEDRDVHDILIQSVDREIIPNANIPHVLKNWRNPPHREFSPRNAWSLFNAYTEVFKGMNSLYLTERSLALHNMFTETFMGEEDGR